MTSKEFIIPAVPQPLSTMDESEDEESFVVLGQSLMPDMDLSFKNLTIESVHLGPIEEGKKLISMKLSHLDPTDSLKRPLIPENHNSQDQAISIASITSNLSPEDIQEKIETLIEENVKLRDIIIKNNAAMESQHEKIVEWKEDVHNTHKLHKQKFAEAKTYIASLVQEKSYLTSELEKNKEIRKLQETELLQMKEELKQKNKLLNIQGSSGSSFINEKEKNSLELDTLKRELKEATKKKEDWEQFFSVINKQKQELKKEKEDMEAEKNNTIIQLKKELEDKDKLIEELKNNMKEREESSNKTTSILTAEINHLKSQTNIIVNLQVDLENARKQLMASQETITRLQQTNSVLEAQLTTEQEKLKELKHFESMKDDYFALQQQLEVYKADFEEERRLKENYKAEHKQLASDFQLVQKRNGELHDELEMLKERGWEFVNRRTSSTSSVPAESPPPITYECPICFFKFRTLKFLEDHVAICNPEPSWL